MECFRVPGAGDGVPARAPVARAGARGGALGRHAPQLVRAERGRRLPAPHAGIHAAPGARRQVSAVPYAATRGASVASKGLGFHFRADGRFRTLLS